MPRRPLSLAALFLVAAAAVAGCQPKQPPPPAPPPPKVTVARPVTKPVVSYREYTGYIDATDTVQIRARAKGMLNKVNFLGREGQEVQQGEVLYEIERREYETALERTRADLTKAEEDLKRATEEEERVRKLRDSKAISPEEYTQKESARNIAKALVDLNKAALRTAEIQLSYTTIKAPIGGRISRTLVTAGNLVGYADQTLLTTIVSLDPVYVYFDAPEKNFVEYERRMRSEGVPSAMDRKVPVEIGVTTEEGYPHVGVIDFRENRVEPGTGTIRLRGLLPNKDRSLTPGLYARVRIPRGAPQDRLCVPEAAVQADQRGRFVYVVKPDNSVEYRPVVPGTRVGTLIAIDEGLKPDDRVVVVGVQRARPGTAVDPQEQGSDPVPAAGSQKDDKGAPLPKSLPATGK